MTNKSGYKPYNIGVLVRIFPPEERKTKGGIILQSDVEAVSITAVQRGELVEVGALAFADSIDKPEVGDTVFFAKYAGQFLYSTETDDEQTYRVMDDHDIRLIRSK